MRVGRAAAITAVAALAAGGCLLAGNSAGSAATPPPTPITLNATGMGSSTCPASLPLGSAIALKTGTTVKITSSLNLNLLSPAALTVSSEANTNPPKSYPLNSAGVTLSLLNRRNL